MSGTLQGVAEQVSSTTGFQNRPKDPWSSPANRTGNVDEG